ncbi:uncharacterized protein LAESUDRAFT_801630, partial [Laetiporus sulphureus 93-53]
EGTMFKRFGEGVGKVVTGINVMYSNKIGSDMLSNEVMLDFDVLDASMECGIFGKMYGTSVIAVERSRTILRKLVLEREVGDNLVNEGSLRESHSTRCMVTSDGNTDAELCLNPGQRCSITHEAPV